MRNKQEHNKVAIAITSFSWLTINKIVSIISGLLISVIVTRYLGAIQNGIVNYVTAYISIFSIFASFGMQDIVTKRFAEQKENSGEIAGAAMLISCLGGMLSIALSILGTFFVENQYKEYILIESTIFLSYPFLVVQYWFIAISRVRTYTIIQSITYVGCVLLKLLGVVTKQSLGFFVILTAVESIIANLGLIVAYRISDIHFSRITIHFDLVIDLIRKCWPLMVSSLAITIYMKCDQLMVGSMIGDYDLGIYSVAVRLSEYWYFIPGIIYTSTLPMITDAFMYNKKNFMNRLQLFSDAFAFIGICAVIGFTVFSKPIILWLYGEEFSNAADIMIVYIWAGLFVCLGNVKLIYCTLNEYSKIQMVCTFLGAVLNIIMNAIFIPHVGTLGAALATVISQALNTWLSCMFFKETREIFWIEGKSLFLIFRVKQIKDSLQNLYKRKYE